MDLDIIYCKGCGKEIETSGLCIFCENTALRIEVKRLTIDLSKPPQEREYCRGCTLPGEVKRLKEVV